MISFSHGQKMFALVKHGRTAGFGLQHTRAPHGSSWAVSSVMVCQRASYHEGENVYGYRRPRKFALAEYSQEELENRNSNANVLRLVKAFRAYGHLEAELDPLGLQPKRTVPELDPSHYGIPANGATINIKGVLHMGNKTTATIEEILQHLRKTYCGRVGFEFTHIPDTSERRWFAKYIESLSSHSLDKESKLSIFRMLARSEVFDNFMAKRFPQVKRYGLEGAESMMPAMDTLFRSANQDGVQEVVIGMPHRGRLNLLTDLLKFEPAALFHKIKGESELPEGAAGTGDVISHLINSVDLSYGLANPVHVSLLHNPSHLEAINPVAMGKARGKQMYLYEEMMKTIDPNNMNCYIGDRVLCLQVHGDAAFTGQGVVMESLGLSDLPHFTAGGSIHLIVNNQIGFTTPATNARSGIYTSDVGKMVNAPVIHVNGDDPEDVAFAATIAAAYRKFFRRDVIIDLITYRRWGHNELDEPAFTQPLMYQNIRQRKSVPKLYEEKLLSEGVLRDASEGEALREAYFAELDRHFKASETYKPKATHLQGKWKGFIDHAARYDTTTTGIPASVLKQVGVGSVAVPQGFEVHPRLEKSHVKERVKMMESGSKLDWATAEALAMGSLMLEGHGVRISGQDVGRGTFSHRHVMLVDQKTEAIAVPLNNLAPKQGKMEIANSSLSELAVLGFEYGMTLENPNDLIIWEAQFGDFFNGAQVTIDTFVLSGEPKWLRQSGLVMLLPHGYDGAGPEHSSCRIERFLQQSDEPFAIDVNNPPAQPTFSFVNCTTPAQYFHVLRRQLKRQYRKPLIVAAPKTLLRLPQAVSDIKEMVEGTHFQPVLGDDKVNASAVKTVVLCSGKIYYDLDKLRSTKKRDDVAIIRLEELSPFPFKEVQAQLSKYSQANEIRWVQEEAQNMGAWSYVEPRLRSVESRSIAYVGRGPSAAPATGISKVHKKEVETLMATAL